MIKMMKYNDLNENICFIYRVAPTVFITKDDPIEIVKIINESINL